MNKSERENNAKALELVRKLRLELLEDNVTKPAKGPRIVNMKTLKDAIYGIEALLTPKK